MSVASPIPCIKLKISHPSSKIYPNPSFIVRGSKAEGPLRRPSAPSLSPPPPLLKPAAPSQPQPQVQSQSPAKVEAGVTFEYQRKMAKEMQDYFKQKKLEEVDQGPFFGFLGKNEIANGSSCHKKVVRLKTILQDKRVEELLSSSEDNG
ncbi:light-harvesting complex-like protein OHP2, chloroplastic isoform X2 [Asparagus officinalis]|uniref:light-harvesting complex-like protein OHP2, chloroplastic isoform X2 n=1 Tax=Asparagus officinalis TaxID=4686 RepID=UPI00098E3CAE|nr:light-harvesting complex-like protein OHP2, chloroplastic isoform X2 [Asparagus officinalis]